MNLSDNPTIEEYREAAHHWQERWKAEADKVAALTDRVNLLLGFAEVLHDRLEHQRTEPARATLSILASILTLPTT